MTSALSQEVAEHRCSTGARGADAHRTQLRTFARAARPERIVLEAVSRRPAFYCTSGLGCPLHVGRCELVAPDCAPLGHNLELDVGGNHLLKNLKAMIGLGVYLNDHDLVDQAIDRLAEQLTVQVLPDGGHFEQSPSYHCQVLADLIDISSLLAAASRPGPAGIEGAIARMRTWLGVMLMPDGDVPLFNDAERVGATRIGALGARAATEGSLTVLADSGYVVGRVDSRIHLVVDVGGPGPKELPAHMHADSLSFELAIDGRRLVIDPGTSVYGGSPQRQWERSTPAHNTISIDGVDQTEVWGAFRAGRVAEASLDVARAVDGGVEIAAHHLGYAHLGGAPVHRRTWRATAERLEVIDRVEGTGLHTVGLRLLVDARRVKRLDGEHLLCDGCAVTVTGPRGAEGGGSLSVRRAQFATAHGSFADAVAIEGTWTCTLPTDLVTVIQLIPTRP